MHSRRLLAIASSLAVLVAFLSSPSTSLAHERRTVAGGKYEVVVGWETEPAYVNQRNAAGIRISRAGTSPAEAVAGAEKTLKLQIRQGAQTRTFDLRAVFGQPGYYVSDILPTRAGDYVLTFVGSIGTDQISETFDSADGKFDSVTASTNVEFPIAASDPAELAQQLQAAEATARSAQTVAYLGVGLGILGCLAAIIVWLLRPRPAASLLSSRDAAVRRAPGGKGVDTG